MSYPPTYIRPVADDRNARRFTVTSSGDGYAVEDYDGRPVTMTTTHRSAVETAADLNLAAANGWKSLSRALGAVDPDDPEWDNAA